MDTVPPIAPEQYESIPFEPDGGVPLGGLLLTMLFAFGAAGAIGVAVSFLHQWIYLVLFFPLLMGLGVGAVGMLGIKKGKVRSPLIAASLGVAAGLQVMLVSYYMDYQQTLKELNKVMNGVQAQVLDFTFAEFMDVRAVDGVRIGKVGQGGDKGMNLGYVGSYIYWLVEVVLAAGVACFMMKGVTTEPFCTSCQSWKNGQVLGAMTIGRESVKDIMNSGDLPQLLKPDLPTGSPVVFTAHACPDCGDEGTLEIVVKEITINGKGEQQQTVLGTWSFAAEALPAWNSVFAVRQQAAEAPSSSAEGSTDVKSAEPN